MLAVRMTQQPPKDDKLAAKYCFRARCKVLDPAKKPIGAYVCYGKGLKIAERVEVTCQLLLSTDFPEGCSCDEAAEVALFEECPVEISNDVYFEIFEST